MSSGKPLTREIVEVILPVLSVVLSQRMQILPAVNAGRVQVVEDEAHGVIADWVHFQYRHSFFPPTVLRSFGECPCTSALGLFTRKYSALRSKE